MKKHSVKQTISLIAIVLLFVFILFFPLPASALRLCVEFDSGVQEAQTCILYYVSDSSSEYSRIFCSQDKDSAKSLSQARFRIDSSLIGHLSTLRMDFPDRAQDICVRSVTVSSAGIIKKSFDPRDFFAADNMIGTHGISDLYHLPDKPLTYIITDAEDPYIVFSDSLVQEIQRHASSYTLTRLGVCLFFAALIYSLKNRIFE